MIRAPGRNDRCTCGSGKRYKECCGRVEATSGPDTAPSIHELMNAALAEQRARRLDAAERLYRNVLSRAPGNPDALHMLGVIRYERGDDGEARELIVRALDLTNWAHRSYRHNLGLVVARMQRAHGGDTAPARLRQRYRAWMQSSAARQPLAQPLVDVIVPCFNHARFVEQALRSIYVQTFRNLRITVIDDGSSDGSADVIAQTMKSSPFPTSFVARANRGAAATINEAIAMTDGAFVNVLNSDDAFAPARVEQMLAATLGGGVEWGFSGVSFIDAFGHEVDPLRNERVYSHSCMMAGIPFRETVGFSLITGNASLSSGNLFFSRDLFDRVGGFRDFRYNHDWDFALRALRLAEPAYVPAATYRYRLHEANTIAESGERARAEANTMMTDYLRWATADDSGGSAFAPSVANWGSTFIVSILEGGMAELVDPVLLRELAVRKHGEASVHASAA